MTLLETILNVLIDAGIPQEIARLIAAGIHYLVGDLERINAGPSEAGVLREIILGIEKDWPLLAGADKFAMARAALVSYFDRHKIPQPAAKALDTMIQLAVGGIFAPVVEPPVDELPAD